MKSPAQLAAGILAFMFGLGIKTAICSLADALLFHPLDLLGSSHSGRAYHVYACPPGNSNGPRKCVAA
jgi:hypothetical protein